MLELQRNLCKDFYAKVSLHMTDGKSPHQRRVPVTPEALKAFTHPLRMALFTELTKRGPATASQLARALGESSGQTSYHLRQLERHGFIEDDPHHAGGRERWWRPLGFALDDNELFLNPDTAIPAREIIQQAIAERAAALTSWLEDFDPTVESPGQLSATTLDLTDAEAEQLATELTTLIERRTDEFRDRGPRPDTRRFRVYADILPVAGWTRG